MSKKTFYLGAAVVLGLGLTAAGLRWFEHRDSAIVKTAGSSAARPKAGAASVPPVEVAQVQTRTLQDDAQAVGTLRLPLSVTLRTEVSARVVHIGFADGARVRKGQLLVQLDDALERAQLSQAQAQERLAQGHFKRQQALAAQGFVSQGVAQDSQANLQVAQAQLALAAARLERLRIRAPFDGVLGLVNASVGEYVKENTALVNLQDPSRLEVDFRLPERYQGRLSVGQPVQVRFDAVPGPAFAGRIAAIDPLLDANTRAVAVRAVLAPVPPAPWLRAGMFARVVTVFSVDPAALVVPEQALAPQGGQQFVFTLKTQQKDGRWQTLAQRTPVQIGLRAGNDVQVLAGLAAGDVVVVAGQQRLQRDVMPVRVVKPPADTRINAAANPAAIADPAPAKQPATVAP